MAKPLLWERLRMMSSFCFLYTSKVVHVLMDDVIDLRQIEEDVW